MESIPGYGELDLIYESANSLIFRSRKLPENRPVVLKLLKDDFPSPDEIVRYRQEYKITRLLQGKSGIIETLGSVDYKNTLFIVLEDFGAESLKYWIEHRDFTLKEKLSLAIRMTECLDTVHQAQVIHKDVNPSNYVFNPDTDELKIIDFGISTQLTREAMELRSPNMLEGTLLYISPEQTGRMNRAVDYRTDYYSLGMTFYQLFTGRLPFRSDDAMELVHCHIARQPPPPHALNPEVPGPVSELILKLIAKVPEERYQSPWGLITDLKKCLEQANTRTNMVHFPLGQADIPDRLLIPQKLYGRERDAKLLEERFEAVCGGQKDLTLVAGTSGVGKTALVQELFRPLTLHRGHFVSGKFDLLQRDRPYTAFVNALKQLIRQLLTEPEESVARWRDRILEAVGRNGQVIVNLLPELERLIGAQPELPELDSTENLNRFNLVFQDFLAVFCQPEHPLVMFIDDLQWADASSLKLLKLILTAQDVRCLHLIGAYRDNEVSPTHPFVHVVGELREQGVCISELTLAPLDLYLSTSILAETLHRKADELADLAQLVQDKTQGNPFFVNAFLNTLHAEGVLWLDRMSGTWLWDLDKIRTLGITDNVAELMVQNVQKLPENTRHAISLAACVGNCFDLETLALICDTPAKRLLATLASALNMGQVIPLSSDYKAVEHGASLPRDRAAVQFKFAHDRIQQAAYTLIQESERPSVHWRIGKLLQQRQVKDQNATLIFDIVNHLNVSANLLESPEERAELSSLNLKTGNKARSSAAYELSLSYLVIARKLLSETDWASQYQHMLAVCESGAEAAYLSTDFVRMREFIQEVQAHARTSQDKAGVICVIIASSVAQGDLAKALEIGISFLRDLGIKLPLIPTKLQAFAAILHLKLTLRSKTIDRLLDLPEQTDLAEAVMVRVMENLSVAAFATRPLLMPIIARTRLEMIMLHGNDPCSAFVYSGIGLLFCGLLRDYENGYRLGEIALQRATRRGTAAQLSRVLTLVHICTKHWKEPFTNSVKPLLQAQQISLENGDFEWGALAAHNYCVARFHLAEKLSDVADEIIRYNELMSKIKQDLPLGWNKIYLQAIRNLQGRSIDRLRLSGEVMDEMEVLSEASKRNDQTGLTIVYSAKVLLSLLYRQYEQTLEYMELWRGNPSLDYMFGSTRIYQYESIARLSICIIASKTEKRKHLRKVAANQRRAKRWASVAPCNYLNMYELVEAERCRVLGQTQQAKQHYERAISGAKEYHFIMEEALAFELAGRFYLDILDQNSGQSHLYQARYAYQKWGASAMVAELDTRYAALLEKAESQATHRSSATISISNTQAVTTSMSSTAELDLASVIKASQGISGEIEVERLLEKLMRILIETAGAQRGALILQDQQEVRVEALIGPEEDARLRHVAMPLSCCEEVSAMIVRFVLRCGENVVLGNISSHSEIFQDEYMLQKKPKSVLCCPIQRHGRTIGALYLENNQAAGAFTPARVELLGMIAAQAAISLENARLFQDLQKALSQAQESIRVKNEFLARTSHELRTPLNHIINIPEGIGEQFGEVTTWRCECCMARFQMEGGEGEETRQEVDTCPACRQSNTLVKEPCRGFLGNPGEAHQLLNQAAQSGKQLLQLVNNILDISELENRKAVVTRAA